MMKVVCGVVFVLLNTIPLFSQIKSDTIGYGWAKTSVNVVVFRKNSLVTHKDMQFAAFYVSTGYIVVAKRKLDQSTWQTARSIYKGNVADAHNSISIMVDGEGYLHIAYDHHNQPLHYVKSLAPGSLKLSSPFIMTGEQEKEITYPEFHRLPSGDLIFMYRSGESGKGNLVMNRYDLKTKTWKRLHNNLIDGKEERNAYWQACVDANGAIHISWVWRETWDVATNHDLCYAVSKDGGKTWLKSNNEKYSLPITAKNAEYAWHIPQNSELINQTSMYADNNGKPYIATYWRGSVVPQYFVVYHDGKQWQKQQATNRKTAFSLSGGGTKKIPISRPQIVIQEQGATKSMFLVYRDAERGYRVSLSGWNSIDKKWKTTDLTTYSVGDWEPTYDTERWRKENTLDLFIQRASQGDGEKLDKLKAQPVTVLSWRPK